MHAIDVRSAVPAEAAAVSRLLAAVIRESYTGTLEKDAVERLVGVNCSLPRISAEIGVPGGAPSWLGWLVAAEADQVVGAAAGGVPAPGEGELYVLCTAPERRRDGIGSALLSVLTERMRRHDARRQSVSLPTEADPALPFYTVHGFTGAGRRLSRGM
ncbi:GNAT family N-acetyltransferase [Streptomyces coeruleorubidus]|uniref:GNAT family N-acetyltransferase n=1 Tax=Streptomyces coeruleorubidus TaxID=116188 RepID=UPI00237F532B|nr:GNAT family N-acetyltransferase [Streptomyces coeruleorubidus]WDV52195.1 GNAT family N-acetyltransferase [Streptomyces coeruleorubidus]